MVKKINHAIVEFFEKLSSWEHDVVREQGMTLPQMHTLEVLGIHGSLRMKELAEFMGITTGTLTVLVDRLEDKAYVRRVPHDTDRRSINVELTDTGRALFKEHDRLHQRLTEDLVAACSPEDREALLRCLICMNKQF
ncbi:MULTISPECIES: MarR family transcriptional regulator [unclassified Pseudodesulfovibrio]|uniref:MarR family winged helix-turn-helix transcriptional regulator n=1 Tax=unclassified Pseudodesulfovibrio TaxID=2661612 RepID=UPI000FEB6E6E|nr:MULTISPECIES: MarR family transcriptional regulator [unclassified Pseudodesulfovibrio]MCJ2166198.1 MarR family transcriptional regulator [Pseudodesulfovibrio sp. S3-i]RWU02332.1 MarR family transcriptional regulator [Pseudodesulfovibrio sp. S3]